MIEAMVALCTFGVGVCLALHLFPPGVRKGKRPRNRGYTLPTARRDRRVPWYPAPVPDDATHVTYVAIGEGEDGRHYAITHQTITDAMREASVESNLVNPVIRRYAQLEEDLYARGCIPICEVRFLLSKQQDGDERWWSGSKWVPRWHRDAAVFDIWGTQF